MNVGAFAVISHAGGYDDRLLSVADYRGLAYRSPLLGGALAFFLLSLIGIPFTGGFFGKFYVFTAALHSGEVWLAVIGLVNSGVAAYYYLRLLTSVYAKPADDAPVQLVPRLRSFADHCPAAHCIRHLHPGHLSRPDSLHGPSRSSDLRDGEPNQSINHSALRCFVSGPDFSRAAKN